ncbi:uncharacterized protein LOC144133421 [Amblyomma americanum]
MPGCCVPQCSNHCRKGTRMFRFPADSNRRKRWLAQVKRDCWEPTAASRICSAHFEETSFEQNRQDGLKKLRPDAVPTLFTYRAIPKYRKPPKKRSCFRPATPTQSPVLDPTGNEPCGSAALEPVFASTAEQTQDSALSDSMSSQDTVSPLQCAQVPGYDLPLTTTLLPPKAVDTVIYADSVAHSFLRTDKASGEDSTDASRLPLPAASPMEAESLSTERSQHSNERSSKEIPQAAFTLGSSTASTDLSLQRQNAELRKRNKDLAQKYRNLQRLHEQTKRKLRSLVKKSQSPQQKMITLEQLPFLKHDQRRALTVKTTKGLKWSEKTIREALQIKRACGTAGYELLRSLSYPLPCNRTLIRRLQNIKFLPGVLHEVFNVLKSKVATMQCSTI